MCFLCSWETDVWRSCSADCGPNGTRSRPVECRQKIRADVTNVLGDSQCTGNKPVSSEPCNRKDCDPDWVPGEWSTVSYRCWKITYVRQVNVIVGRYGKIGFSQSKILVLLNPKVRVQIPLEPTNFSLVVAV